MSLLKVENLHTYFDTRNGLVKAVNGISFTLEEGKTLGIVGESGSGKSQTAMSIIKLFQANQKIHEGTITFNNQVLSLMSDKELEKIRGNEISVIFQEPISSLNPVLTVEKQLTEVLILHQKLTKKEAVSKAYEMLNVVKIQNPQRVMKAYPHQLSGGMSQRVMIAMALSCNPKLLIADEPTTALDVIIQAEILKLMNELKAKYKTSILFITHDLGVVSKMVDDVIVMHGGRIVEKAPVDRIFKNPYHPYTKKLLAAFLKTDLERNSSHKSLDLYEKENDVFDFDRYKTLGIADESFLEVEPNHFVSCHIK
ncbi:ABC-type dipeptide/oligopeptide transport system, ATPase component [Paracholeplasma brassicae]|uniref:ABC-type dipeptide/oligopeptide transport system, ATPase component n=1 Tax=Acholeplasma brassicae TaxID=61635 RepID=U4KPW0_9MOLU|nr:ABC transporter ATP-binding protein [Paracholeplasma brassicae]CCV66532.1 ABC-type dipeptide/oligopeptide transport system, ATPase component [Paracholeplasma brassicae]